MGRSPVLVTLRVTVLRPAFNSISPSWMNISPGIMHTLRLPARKREEGKRKLPDRLMHGDELRSVRERRLDLHVVDHLGNAVHHLRAGDDLRAALHQFGDGPAAARGL